MWSPTLFFLKLILQRVKIFQKIGEIWLVGSPLVIEAGSFRYARKLLCVERIREVGRENRFFWKHSCRRYSLFVKWVICFGISLDGGLYGMTAWRVGRLGARIEAIKEPTIIAIRRWKWIPPPHPPLNASRLTFSTALVYNKTYYLYIDVSRVRII